MAALTEVDWLLRVGGRCWPIDHERLEVTKYRAGEVVMCHLTRYEGTKTIEAWQCRVSGYVPAPAPGRKPKAA